MKRRVPTQIEERTEKLEYAFRNLTSVLQVFPFTDKSRLLGWLGQLNMQQIEHEPIGIYLNRRSLYILYRLKKDDLACGVPVKNTCEIWCKLGLRKLSQFNSCTVKILEHSKKGLDPLLQDSVVSGLGTPTVQPVPQVPNT